VNLSAGKVRVGKEFDGGYVVPSDWAKIRHLHSFGVGSDNSFEICFAQAGAEVHCYDHSVPSLPQPHSNIHLFQKKVVGVPGDSPDEIAWNDIVREVPEEPSALKMDIEGAEAVVFADPSCQQWLPKTEAIAIELHDDSGFGPASDLFHAAIRDQRFQVSHSGELTICLRADQAGV
jgi:hypothetical protein